MAISPNTNLYISQLGLLREIDASTGPEGPHGVTAYWLVPTNGYHNGERFPHEVSEELKDANYDTDVYDGIEYYKVPEESSNLPGRLSHYAQLTGVAELQNPPGGGVNRVAETLENTAEATVAPDAVSKFVADNDSFEEARKKQSAENERVTRQVTVSPAREPADGKLVTTEESDSNNAQEVPKQQRSKADSKPAGKSSAE